MKTNTKGLDLIKQFEGFIPKAYLCPAGKLTIGYGHTGNDFQPTTIWTEEQATTQINDRMDKMYQEYVEETTK